MSNWFSATYGLACTILEAQYQKNQRIQELIQQQQHSTLALTLPESELPTFSGNPIEYWSFGQAFENQSRVERPVTVLACIT